MDNINSQKTETQIVTGIESYKMIISNKVENKIRYLCSKLYNTEWSGTLFYDYSGSLECKDLIITCKDFLIQDIGNSVYTTFETSPDIISYMIENDLLDCQCGLIHSHHSMSTFFSGTDINTLCIEGLKRNHFVSLIVNNSRSYNAAITSKIEVEKVINTTYTYKTFQDKSCTEYTENINKNTSILYNYLTIEFETNSNAELDNILIELQNKKEIKEESNEEINYPSLFPEEYKDINWGKNDEDILDIDPSIIKHLMCQLLTGNIFVDSTDIEDVKEYADNYLEEKFNAHFTDEYNFKLWAEMFVSCVIEGEGTQGLQELYPYSDVYYNVCTQLIDIFSTFNENIYINTYIKILNTYL